MAQVCKLEATAQLKSPAEKFYNILKSRSQQIPHGYTEKVHDIEVQEGDWETPGSVKLWKIDVEGKEEVFKERIEVDEANKTLNFVAVGGNVLELYKSYKLVMKVEMSGTVKLIVEYEKLNQDVPAPYKYLQFVINVVNDIDASLVN